MRCVTPSRHSTRVSASEMSHCPHPLPTLAVNSTDSTHSPALLPPHPPSTHHLRMSHSPAVREWLSGYLAPNRRFRTRRPQRMRQRTRSIRRCWGRRRREAHTGLVGQAGGCLVGIVGQELTARVADGWGVDPATLPRSSPCACLRALRPAHGHPRRGWRRSEGTR